jgi:ribonuclease Z
MRPLFHPSLVNDPFGDPGVYIDCLFEKRAVLFDLGDIRALAPRKLLRISDVFVSHTHMDHFMGFDWLLRVCLGRSAAIRLYGPAGFIDQVGSRLAGYTWNLVESYDTDLELTVTELLSETRARRTRFRCKQGFAPGAEETVAVADGVLHSEEAFRVRCALLDHKTPCLAFALEEDRHLNVWKNRLDELGVPTGPWLAEFKRAVRRNLPDDTPITAAWQDRDGRHERVFPLAELRDSALRIVPGQKIAYVTDLLYSETNVERIVRLAHGADVLFIEAPFLDSDAGRAAERFHLTAHQAGSLARAAGAKAVVPFHFSPRYEDDGAALTQEFFAAYGAVGQPVFGAPAL